MTEGIPKLWTYEQLSRHQLRAAILTRSVPKLPFCCVVKSLGTPVKAISGVLHNTATSWSELATLRPKTCNRLYRFPSTIQTLQRNLYIYICIWNTADLYYSNRASYQTFCEYEAKKHYSVELGNFICVQLRSRHWQKKKTLCIRTPKVWFHALKAPIFIVQPCSY